MNSIKSSMQSEYPQSELFFFIGSDSIENFDEELTVVIIAHRITTLKSCDMIIKLNSDYTMQILSYEELMNFKINEGDLNVK